MEEQNSSETKISFKKIKRKNFRHRTEIEDTECEEEQTGLSECLEENKEIRKFRKKHGGVSIDALLVGKKETVKEEDPFKTKSGGMIDLNTLKNASKVDDAYDTGIGTSFSAETNRRDEDAEMQKFIEEQLSKKRGTKKEETSVDDNKYLSPEEAALRSVPDFLRESSSKKSEEMLSNQMLNGIPEVDLGIDAKISNIEATENAKQKVLLDSLMKKNRPSDFVPKNFAVNYAQHNRYNMMGMEKNFINNHKTKRPVEAEPVVEPVVGGGVKISKALPKAAKSEKATDDYHYEKFRKHTRRPV